MSAYDILAGYYDVFQQDLDPVIWADFVEWIAKKYGQFEGDGVDGRPLLCDLGCGTGLVTCEFAARGYDTVGVDNSPSMLDRARERAETEKKKVLWLLQDMTALDLFGTMDIFVSLLDTVNHITDPESLEALLRSFYCFLNPGGLFIFDAATEKHFRETLGKEFFYSIEEDFAVLWENDFDERSKINTASLTMFGTEDGKNYSRSDEDIVERYYPDQEIREMAARTGLEVVGVFGDLKKRKPNDKDERVFYCLRRPVGSASESQLLAKKRSKENG
ncbi:MAG: methyltransferase domain-containing protein [Clostridiales bacterium]|nr:methyltransferase domain-containing protein [Clostridiales bacterium]